MHIPKDRVVEEPVGSIACRRRILPHQLPWPRTPPPPPPLPLPAVSITDKASVIFGGSDAPTALGCLYSIGAIAQGSNGQITAAVTDALAPFGVDEDRIYINFFDVPRANVGWSRRTFAG